MIRGVSKHSQLLQFDDPGPIIIKVRVTYVGNDSTTSHMKSSLLRVNLRVVELDFQLDRQLLSRFHCKDMFRLIEYSHTPILFPI